MPAAPIRARAPGWAATPYTQRIEHLRRAAALIEEQVFELAAAVSLGDVGGDGEDSGGGRGGGGERSAEQRPWEAETFHQKKGFGGDGGARLQ